ncbi:hypothetical protein NX779_03525 [Mycoplasma cottewii]|uniref:Transmembrane protein n=1 Tax=Mycoplasma cottewii TaxID=51364 RepID=A0ABY5U0N1_9MOLU|nr:hypothetical protein [Mycoplasma cottewii]UWD34854.1 hypothetical protein NX779_03525 [Mycoplasma cottewii]
MKKFKPKFILLFNITLFSIITPICLSLINQNKVVNKNILSLYQKDPTSENLTDSSTTNETNPKPDAPKKPEVDKSFNTFKNTLDNKLKEELSKIFDKIQKFINDELEKDKDKLKEESKTEEYTANIEKRVYLNSLKKLYVSSKKDDFISDPSQFGFHITFPYILAVKKEHNTGTVIFNNKKYENVRLSLDDAYDYSKIIDKKLKEEVIKNKDQIVNTISSHIFNVELDEYFKKFDKEVIGMIFNEKELPKLGQDFILEPIKNEDNDEIYVGSAKILDKHKSWKDYVINKIKPKFIDFDLTKNQEYKDKNESEPTPATTPTIPDPLKPVVPNDKRPSNINPTQLIQALPKLKPYVSYKYANTNSISEIINRFESENNQENKKNFFFFKNPINTRFEYTVESKAQSTSSDSQFVTVKIRDLLNEAKFRTYQTEIINPNKNVKYSFLLEKQNKEISKTFLKLYKALMLDEKLNYKTIGHGDLQSSVLGFVESANKIINDQNFNNLWSKVLNNYYNSIDTNQINNPHYNPKAIWSSSRILIDKILSSLISSNLNNQPVFHSLSNAFLVLKSDLDQFTTHTASREKFLQKAKKYNINLKYVDNVFINFDKSNTRLISTANDKFKNFNTIKWFDDYIKNVKDSREYVEIIKILLAPVDLQPNSKEYEEFNKYYQLAIQKNKDEQKILNNYSLIIGISLLVLSTLFLITNTYIYLHKNKNKKQLKSTFIILTILSLSVTLISIILILVGVKG